MSTVPEYAEPVTGFRWWNIGRDGANQPRLVSPLYAKDVMWEPGMPFDAHCEKHGHKGEIPTVDGGHRCGMHASNSERTMFTAFSAGTVAGAVDMGGRTMKYQSGWIAETVKIKHLYLPPTNNRARLLMERITKQNTLACATDVLRIAEIYGVPYKRFPVDALLSVYNDDNSELVQSIKTFLENYGWKEMAFDG